VLWVFLGTSAPDEDAHVVETDSTGKVSAAVAELGGNTATTTGVTVNTTAGALSMQVNGTDNGGLAVGVTNSTAISAINNSALPTISTLNSGAGPDIQTLGTAVIGGILTTSAGINLGTQTISGTGGIVDVTTIQPTVIEWDDAGITIPTVDRSIKWNSTSLLARGSDGTVRSISVPSRDAVASFTTNAPIANTGCAAQREIQVTEPVWIRISFAFRHTAAPATGLMSVRIAVTGSVSGGPTDLFLRTYRVVSGEEWRTHSIAFPWTPITDFPAAGTEDWSAEIRVGSNLGADLETEDLGIELISNVQV
jgi:hypothetical protein